MFPPIIYHKRSSKTKIIALYSYYFFRYKKTQDYQSCVFHYIYHLFLQPIHKFSTYNILTSLYLVNLKLYALLGLPFGICGGVNPFILFAISSIFEL